MSYTTVLLQKICKEGDGHEGSRQLYQISFLFATQPLHSWILSLVVFTTFSAQRDDAADKARLLRST
jgi:hypothetical protein